jgi:hypothetical protein
MQAKKAVQWHGSGILIGGVILHAPGKIHIYNTILCSRCPIYKFAVKEGPVLAEYNDDITKSKFTSDRLLTSIQLPFMAFVKGHC